MFEIFRIVITQPILNLIVGFYKLFLSIGVPGAFGFSIISITVLVRALMHPFFQKQLHTANKMKEIKPHLDKAQKKHKGDAKKLQEEQMRLYKEAGINPASGCLFALVQFPIFIGLYQTMQLFLSHDKGGKLVSEINKQVYFASLKIQSIDPNFFGLNLAQSPSQSNGLWYLYLVPVITGGLQYLQTKFTMPDSPSKPKTEESNGKKEKDKEEKPSTADEFQKAMGTQMKYFFPVMIGYFAYTLPLGLSMYWNIFSLFSIISHYHTKSKEAKLKLIISAKGRSASG